MRTTLAFILSGLTATQVSATWNRNADHFNSPQYNNNECSDKQKGGFNWGDVSTGGISSYDGFNFKGGKSGGWTCANSFGKRDSLTKRTFNSKCIKNSVSKDTPANMDCTSKKDGFSIKEIQVSVEFDCDLEFHYTMPDKSTCKHTTSCKKEGTTVSNTQCGGAESVDVYLGNHSEQGKDSCEIGFHSIGFDCSPGYTPTPKSSTPVATPSSTPIKSSSEVKSTPVETPSTTPVGSSSSSQVYSPSTPVETPSSTPVPSSSGGVYTPPPQSSFTTVPIYANSSSVPGYTPVSSAPAEESSTPAGYTPGSSAPAAESTTSVSVGYTPSSLASSVLASSVPQSSSSPTPSGSYTPPGGYSPPECLPKCMNTWIELQTECKDNTDASCYCKNADFTKSVIECVAAWSTDAETQQALQYLLGICAPAVPQNPGLITNCPSTIPLNPTAPATPSGSAPAVQTTAPPAGSAPPVTPVTTITYSTTMVVPCGCAASTSTTSTISTCVTVPQVVFTTATATVPGVTPSAPVQLVPGTPAPVSASATLPPYPIPSGSSPSGFGTVTQPSASASYPAYTSSSPQFTGAAVPHVKAGVAPALIGAALAFFAL